MKTYFASTAILALLLTFQSAGQIQARTRIEGLDTLKTAAAPVKATARASTFQHHLFGTKKRNLYRLAVAGTDAENTEMRVYNQQGQLMHRSEAKGDTVLCEFDVNALQPGAYTLHITTGQHSAEEKFTVQ